MYSTETSANALPNQPPYRPTRPPHPGPRAPASTARACSPLQAIAEGETHHRIQGRGHHLEGGASAAIRTTRRSPNHTFYFHIDDEHVIDGDVGGNAARWINHSCEPNCEADEAGRPRLHQGAAQHRGRRRAELRLRPDHRRAATRKKLKAEFPCWCGAEKCRGTLLAPKRRTARRKTRRKSKKDKKKAKKRKSASGPASAEHGRALVRGRDRRRLAPLLPGLRSRSLPRSTRPTPS